MICYWGNYRPARRSYLQAKAGLGQDKTLHGGQGLWWGRVGYHSHEILDVGGTLGASWVCYKNVIGVNLLW